MVPYTSCIKLSINGKFTDLIDPKGLSRDRTRVDGWGHGDVELRIDSEVDMPDAMQLILQVMDKQLQG